ncbi:hypothetical protein [Pengzhenrongella sp.]|jgi:hypothetical protein
MNSTHARARRRLLMIRWVGGVLAGSMILAILAPALLSTLM